MQGGTVDAGAAQAKQKLEKGTPSKARRKEGHRWSRQESRSQRRKEPQVSHTRRSRGLLF